LAPQVGGVLHTQLYEGHAPGSVSRFWLGAHVGAVGQGGGVAVGVGVDLGVGVRVDVGARVALGPICPSPPFSICAETDDTAINTKMSGRVPNPVISSAIKHFRSVDPRTTFIASLPTLSATLTEKLPAAIIHFEDVGWLNEKL